MILISNMLPTNREDAITADDISKQTGLSKRDVRRAIRNERRDGAWILADTCDGNHGYWLWDGKDTEELRRYVCRVEKTVIDILNTLKPLRQELKQRNGGE